MYVLKQGGYMNIVQVTQALKVLKNMQTCIVNRDTYIPGVGDLYNQDENYRAPFNLHVSFGICWHVWAGTPGGIGVDNDFLRPVFAELGYKNIKYPVESTFMPDGSDNDFSLYQYKTNPYNGYWGTDLEGREHPDCAIRRKLVDQLVEYFENKLKELQ